MNSSFFNTYVWYNALTLKERIASLRGVQCTNTNVEMRADIAEQRMQRWQSQPPFFRGSLFGQRLAMDGICKDELLYLLGEPLEAVHNRSPIPPVWLAELAEGFSHASFATSFSHLEALCGYESGGFLDAIAPLLVRGCDRLHQEIQSFTQMYSQLPFDPNTIKAILFANLPGQLLMLLSRTMVLELNVARLQGLLEGDTTEERFYNFLQRLLKRDASVAFLQEYPVLARQLTICIDRWVTFSLEFLQHLCADWEVLRTTFSSDNEPGVLMEVDGNVSDRHRGGRSVLILRFTSGLEVVYKPKSLAIDVHFQELLTWLNARGNHPPFQILKVLERGTYGWVEFVVARACSSFDELRRFYERLGGYLALLYVLEATDFHSQNLIAAGENPVLLDLESLFHPRIESIIKQQKYQSVRHKIAYSVLRVGLLPQRKSSNAKLLDIDFSGMGGVAGQLTPYEVPQWEGAATDAMRLVRKRMAIAGSQNRPTLNNHEINLLDYTEAIATGFSAIYRLLIKYREDLLAQVSPLSRFAQDEIRVILRPTQTYSTLLRESFHPNLLRNSLDRDRFFDRLWVAVENRPYLAKVIPGELSDLQNGDIPMFVTRPNSHDLWDSSGNRITNFFDISGMGQAQGRIQEMGEKDLAQQLWFIRASLASLAIGETQIHQTGNHPAKKPQTPVGQSQLLAEATKIGERLEILAIHEEEDISWIGLKLTSKDYWSLVPLDMSLYDGIPGVALFLANLGTVTRQHKYTTLARAVLKAMQRQIDYRRSSSILIGAFNGWGGIIYTLVHLSKLWDEAVLLSKAESLVELFPPLIEQDEQFDIIGGAAGCIGSLLSLYRCTTSERTLAVAIQCGDHLLAKAQHLEVGIGWMPKFGGNKPLTGFSHGAAGIAWALLELAAVTGSERFRKAALDAIAYERSLFQPEKGNWPDLRNFATTLQANNDMDSNQHTCMTAWCHGAPGIGLARLRCLQHFDDAEMRSEINTALKTTLAHGFGDNHSLCHGDLGNIELFLQASTILDEPEWGHQINRLAAIILESINQHGWLCGIPLGVESPGLMTGLAGIGYELLRLAEPKLVPSVLVLELPKLACIG